MTTAVTGLDSFISKLHEEIKVKDAELDQIYTAAEARMGEDHPMSDEQRESADTLDEEIRALREQLDKAEERKSRREKAEEAMAARQRGPGASQGFQMVQPLFQGQHVVRGEPRTYDQQQGQSFLRDAFAFTFPGSILPLAGDMGSPRDRIERHMREFERDGIAVPGSAGAADQPSMGLPAPRWATKGAARQSQTSDIGGPQGALVPEQYYPGLAGLQLYAGAPFVAMCNTYELPTKGMQLSIPRFTAGPSATRVAEENTVADTDVTASTVTMPVVTAAGRCRVTRQLIERGDMAEDYILRHDGHRDPDQQGQPHHHSLHEPRRVRRRSQRWSGHRQRRDDPARQRRCGRSSAAASTRSPGPGSGHRTRSSCISAAGPTCTSPLTPMVGRCSSGIRPWRRTSWVSAVPLRRMR